MSDEASVPSVTLPRAEVMARRGYVEGAIRATLCARFERCHRVPWSHRALLLRHLEREADLLEAGQQTLSYNPWQQRLLLCPSLYAWEMYLLTGRDLPVPGFRATSKPPVYRSVLGGDTVLKPKEYGWPQFLKITTSPSSPSA